MKYLLLIIFSFALSGCSSNEISLVEGQCVERPYGVYTYKITSVDEKFLKVRPLNTYGKGEVILSRKERLFLVRCK